jgi:ABC-2 type transport system ATP-binding protein
MSTISIQNLTKRYGSVLAVDDLSFDVEPGRVTGFLGPNGSGKTTTLRMLLGLTRPKPGTATIGGLAYHQLPEPVRQVGAALDSNTFHPGRSAAQHLRIIATATDLPRRRVEEVLGLVGLADVAGRRVGGFSLGMRQRLSLAGALIGDPGVLIFDEPLNGLDPDGIRWLRGLLRELAAQGRTVFVSSHLLSEVAQTVDDVVVLSRGRLRAQTTLSDLVARTSVVRARTPDASRLLEVLAAAGLQVRLVDGTTVEARSATADAVGMAAAAAGVPILELSRQDEDLESLFLDLVQPNQQNHQNQEIAA